MDCERVREEFVDRLTGTLSPDRSTAIDEHLAGCAACRAETERLRELWTELGTLRAPAGGGAGGRVARLIDTRNAAEARDTRATATRRSTRALLAVGALAASLLVGVVVGRRMESEAHNVVALPRVTTPIGRERYVLLLHGPARTTPSTPAQATADSAAEQAIVAEYRAWATGLRDSGALVIAEKLADDPLTMLTANGATPMTRNTADELGGFFLIQVADSAEAFRIARACPHLRHGGTVQVRKIQPT
jgi:hypothetical protein